MFLFVKTVKYWVYFLDFSVKNHEGVVGELRNSNHIWFMSCTEKYRKITKFSGHPFIVNFTFEIYKYFPNIFITWISKNIWIRFLRAMFNWSPQFYTHLFRSLFELLLILWQFLLLKQLVPNYRLKVKLQLRTHPKISSEIIPA